MLSCIWKSAEGGKKIHTHSLLFLFFETESPALSFIPGPDFGFKEDVNV